MADLLKKRENFCKEKSKSRADNLFEHIRKRIGCEYISDMKNTYYRKKAGIAMAEVDVYRYSMKELEDMADYLYKQKLGFETAEQAQKYFKRATKKNLKNKKSVTVL